MIDRHLYLPESWISDPDRCRQAGIPPGTELQTKPRVAIDMLHRALDARIPFTWYTADEAFGQVKYLRVWLEERDVFHVVATTCNDDVSAHDIGHDRVDTIIAGLPAEAWKRLSAGDGAHGPRLYDWVRVPIRPFWAPGRGHWLLARRSITDPTELAYYICYAARRTSLDTLIWVAGRRWAVAECFKQAKQETGLDHYQVRTWRGWYAHITLSMLALAWLAAVRAGDHRAADGGAGVVLGFGNYAGDRLNFKVAADRLIAEGIDTRIVYVTDDIASAAADEQDKRRGIAGMFTVFKLAGAAAENGADLDEVERIMRAANAATYSFGVAFDGCTLPGAKDPLFTVERGRMDFGLGIHGEPGITSVALMSSAELAVELVSKVLNERPDGVSGRAAVVLNGLGATKYEELFALYGDVAQLLTDAGVEPVAPEVGELVTSLDMAGCSLSFTWLDDELEGLWLAPADTPAFRRGSTSPSTKFTQRRTVTADMAAEEEDEEKVEASEASIAAAVVARKAVAALSETIEANKEKLGRIDAIAGDGDHGIGMSRGARAARQAAETTEGGVQTVLVAAGSAFGDHAGGTSGILWGLLLDGVGKSLGNADEVTDERVAQAVKESATNLQIFSEAQLGDKTMLDALFPFVDTLVSGVGKGKRLADAWRKAAEVCTKAGEETASMVPKIGRARPLAERSVGTPDAGAISMGLIVTAIGQVLGESGAES